MTRLEAMIEYYRNVDIVTTALVMLAVWAAGTGHLVDWMTEHRFKIAVPIYWSIVITVYVIGILFVGLTFS
jgi:hypothetical protein